MRNKVFILLLFCLCAIALYAQNINPGKSGGGTSSSSVSNIVNAALAWTNLSTTVTVLRQDTNISIYSDPSFETFGFGYQIFQAGAPDFDNTAFGYQALNALGVNSTAKNQENTAVGSLALNNATNSQWNTAVGYDSLLRMKKGSGNVAIGVEALNHLQPTSIGDFSANPGESVGIGYNAGKILTTAQRNVVIGAYANGVSATGSSSNVVVGYSAVGGHNDVVIGQNAGISVFNGGFNVVIGDSADNFADKTNSITLGWNSTISTDNQVNLGNSITATVTTAGKVHATNGYTAYASSSIPTNSAAFTTVAPGSLHSVTLGKGWTNDLGVRADLVISVKYTDAATGDPSFSFTNSITGEAWTNSVAFGLTATTKDTVVIPDLSPNDRGSFTDLSGAGATVTFLTAWWKLK